MEVKNKIILLIVILPIIALTFFFSTKPKESAASYSENSSQISQIKKMDTVKIEVLKEGEGEVSKTGDILTVDYTGTLENGTKFDSSIGRSPFSFTLGENMVIQGWEQGMLNMKVGEKRKLFIPSSLGYGSRGAGGAIPPNANLIFEVDLLKIN